MQQTKLEQSLTKQQELDAMFDYAEAPIKEWLANVFEKPLMDVFPDYKKHRESIGISSNNNSFVLYFSSVTDDRRYLFTHHDTRDDSVKKAIDIMFNALYPVYTSVVCSSELNEKLIGVYPYFDETTMTFSLRAVNQYTIMRSQCKNALEQCVKKMALAEPNSDYYNQLIEARNKVLEGMSLCTDELINKRDAELVQINNEYSLMPKLHLIVIKNCLDEDEVGRRLPTFGLEFQDPDEDNYIDMLKKEQDIVE
jgi:hypothetical protein